MRSFAAANLEDERSKQNGGLPVLSQALSPHSMKRAHSAKGATLDLCSAGCSPILVGVCSFSSVPCFAVGDEGVGNSCTFWDLATSHGDAEQALEQGADFSGERGVGCTVRKFFRQAGGL